MSDESLDSSSSRLAEAGEWCSYSGDEGEEEGRYVVENGEEISSSSLSDEWINEMPVDRLSALPDSILSHILSFLETSEAAKTRFLSKRWQFLWTDSTRLVFSQGMHQDVLNFMAFVHRTLLLSSGNRVEKFEVYFDYDYERFAAAVDVWVKFAVKNRVKEVNLLLNCDQIGLKTTWSHYYLPQLMYSNSSLAHLSLRGCILDPRGTVEWGSLTTLELEDVELDEDVIQKILSGCPVLYDFSLDDCWGLKNCLEVNSQSLRKLAITEYNNSEGEESLLEISAPYIHSLRIVLKTTGIGRKLRLTNISPLVRAYIDFEFEIFNDSVDESMEAMSYTNEIFGSLQHVESLEVGDWFISVLSMLAIKGWPLPQSGWKHLTVYATSEEYCSPGIICPLESSPNLETFVISGYGYYNGACTLMKDYFPGGLPASYSKKDDLNSDLLHLKTVNIAQFGDANLGCEPLLTLVRLLLKRATVLEKMVIDLRGYPSFSSTNAPNDSIKIAETLLSYPRSSPKAVVVVSH